MTAPTDDEARFRAWCTNTMAGTYDPGACLDIEAARAGLALLDELNALRAFEAEVRDMLSGVDAVRDDRVALDARRAKGGDGG